MNKINYSHRINNNLNNCLKNTTWKKQHGKNKKNAPLGFSSFFKHIHKKRCINTYLVMRDLLNILHPLVFIISKSGLDRKTFHDQRLELDNYDGTNMSMVLVESKMG